MKVIGINGSPRKKSNTRFLLEKSLEKVKIKAIDIEIFDVQNILKTLKNPFCIHCSSPCNQSCYLETELEYKLKELSRADGIIIASPVYFGSVTAQLKAFWDKTRHIRSELKLIGKPGAAIAIGGSQYGGQETTIRTIHDMMLIQGMTIVGNGVKGFNAGHQGSCARQPVFENQQYIKDAENMGTRIADEVISRNR